MNIRIGLGAEKIIRLESGVFGETTYTPIMWVQGLNDGGDGNLTRTGLAVFDAQAALTLLDFLRGREDELRKLVEE